MYVRPRLLYEKKFCSPRRWRLRGTSDGFVEPSRYWRRPRCFASTYATLPILVQGERNGTCSNFRAAARYAARSAKVRFHSVSHADPSARKPNVRQQARMAGLCVGARRAAVGLRGVTSRRGAAFSSTQWPVLFGYLFFTDKEKVTGSDAQHRKKARRYAVPKIPPKPPSRYFCSFC